MSWHYRGLAHVGIALAVATLCGCYAAQPAYWCENGDLSHYLETATDIEYPDVVHSPLDEVTHALPPFTLSDPFEGGKFTDICLEDAVSITLQNSKVFRNLGSVRTSVDGRSLQPDELIGDPQPASSATVYDPALVESNPLTGVEGALADFDAQLSSSLFWNRRDRQQNFQAQQGRFTFLNQDDATFDLELSKRTATGTELFFRNVTVYTDNALVPPRAIPTDYTTALEIEARQPLLRGRGTQINRIPVIIARINNDISLADFEASVRNLVMDVEQAYWDLHCLYRILGANKRARDLSLETWREIKADLETNGQRTAEDELRARGQYYAFRAQAETTLRQLYNAESHLRWLMGLAATDGCMLRPTDEPTASCVYFDWHEVHCEALVRSAELRRQKWVIKQRELELVAARNELLPDLNATALYRWFGIGNDLIDSSGTGLVFPQQGSNAWESLTDGNFQEFSLGFEFGMPVGFRRALAGVRNGQLALSRERARLEDMELNASHLLSQAIRDMDGLLVLAQSHFNQWAAYRSEVEGLRQLEATEGVEADYLLRAFQRAVAAEIIYLQSVCDYNKAIAQVHFRKGSLLDYNSICLAEGPWPKKAYFDALGHARRRSNSKYIDYGWTRPDVVSQGPIPHGIGPHQPGPALPVGDGLFNDESDLAEPLPDAVTPVPTNTMPELPAPNSAQTEPSMDDKLVEVPGGDAGPSEPTMVLPSIGRIVPAQPAVQPAGYVEGISPAETTPEPTAIEPDATSLPATTDRPNGLQWNSQPKASSAEGMSTSNLSQPQTPLPLNPLRGE